MIIHIGDNKEDTVVYYRSVVVLDKHFNNAIIFILFFLTNVTNAQMSETKYFLHAILWFICFLKRRDYANCMFL